MVCSKKEAAKTVYQTTFCFYPYASPSIDRPRIFMSLLWTAFLSVLFIAYAWLALNNIHNIRVVNILTILLVHITPRNERVKITRPTHNWWVFLLRKNTFLYIFIYVRPHRLGALSQTSKRRLQICNDSIRPLEGPPRPTSATCRLPRRWRRARTPRPASTTSRPTSPMPSTTRSEGGARMHPIHRCSAKRI